jgi:hypothetical protein
MDLYIASCHDRHIDPVIRVFDTEERAIAFCDAFVAQMRPKAKPVASNLSGTPFSCRYYRQFSVEGDHVRVNHTTLNDE